MAFAMHLREAIGKAAKRFNARHPRKTKSKQDEACVEPESEMPEDEVSIQTPKPRSKKKGADARMDEKAKGNKAVLAGKIRTHIPYHKGVDEEYHEGARGNSAKVMAHGLKK